MRAAGKIGSGGFALAALLSACSNQQVASDVPPTPPAPARTEPPPPGMAARGNPDYVEGGHLAERYGISREEAARRHTNEELTSSYNRTLMRDRETRVSAVWIRHEPSYAIIVNAKPPYDSAALLALAPEALRGDVQFVDVSRTRAEISRDEDRLIAAFRNMGFAWSGGYRVQEDRFRYTAGSPTSADRLRAAIPADLRDDVDIAVESQPVPL